MGILATVGLLAVVACGGEEAAPAPTATAVVAAPVATATPTPAPKVEDQPKSGGLYRFQGTSDPASFDVHTAPWLNPPFGVSILVEAQKP